MKRGFECNIGAVKDFQRHLDVMRDMQAQLHINSIKYQLKLKN